MTTTPAPSGPAEEADGAVVGGAVLALGDSIAAGIGAPHVDEGCFALVHRHLRRRRPALSLVNLAIPGEGSESMLRAGGQLERAETEIAHLAADGRPATPILLSLGGNDAMEARVLGDDTALSRLADNLDTILLRLDTALRATGSRLAGHACLITVYNPFELVDAEVPSADDLAPRRASRPGHNRVLRAAAAAHGVRVADVSAAFTGRCAELTWVRTGDIHPSGAGHGVIAEVVLAACGLA